MGILSYLMALDQGTSSSRAIVYDATGTPLAVAQQGLDTLFPAPGWVELDPERIWLSVLETGREALSNAGIAASDLAAIGITNQRETTLVWERKTSACLGNAIVWQDRRTADRCEAMATDRWPGDGDYKGASIEALIQAQTGLLIDPYFSSTKLAWMLDQAPDLRERAAAGELCFGTVDSYLLWRLSQGAVHRTDASNASRTQLFDIHRQQWSEELLGYFDIPEVMLPEVVDNAGALGTAAAEWFGAEVPVCGMAGDQQSALIGQGCFTPGMTKSTYGTGCFVMANTGTSALKSTQRLLTTVAYRLNGQTVYALEGSIFVAGVAIKWARDGLRLISDASETADAFAETGGDSAGVYVVPAFTGLGAPHWVPDARATITGMGLETTRAQVITALLQAVGFQTQELLQAMAADGAAVDTLRVDGGMVVNDALCQFIADINGVPVERPADVETTALGAAMLAGVGCGLYKDLDTAAQCWRLENRFTASMSEARREALLAGFARAVRQTLAR